MSGPRTSGLDPVVDYVVGKAMNRHAKSLVDLVVTVTGSRIKVEPGTGQFGGDLVAQSNNVDLRVMATIGRTGIRGLLIGNTAERVIDEVDCSIPAHKPRGFVCPVALDAERRRRSSSKLSAQ